MEMNWVADLMTELSPTILRAKGQFAAMALSLAQKDLEALAGHASRFSTDSANVVYRDRVNRAKRLVSLAVAGDVDGVRSVFIE